VGNSGLGQGNVDTYVFVGRRYPHGLTGIHGPDPHMVTLACVQALPLEREVFGPAKQPLGTDWPVGVGLTEHDGAGRTNSSAKPSRRCLHPCCRGKCALEVGPAPQDEKVDDVSGFAVPARSAGWEPAQVNTR